MCGMDGITQIRLLWLGGLDVLTGVVLGTVWSYGVGEGRPWEDSHQLFPAAVSIRALVDRHTDGGYIMKYMLLIYIDALPLSETRREECYAEPVQLTHQLKIRGQYLAANLLHPTSTAISVRVRDGKALVTDGPFAETREQLGG